MLNFNSVQLVSIALQITGEATKAMRQMTQKQDLPCYDFYLMGISQH
jgi:hypothetical protein